jgi:hypothetical protein
LGTLANVEEEVEEELAGIGDGVKRAWKKQGMVLMTDCRWAAYYGRSYCGMGFED